mmetsp:Transcript_9178/g.41770  ORF Transcript_9178/g.41770 Transcript_9178/m.41770 type:complete len:266 (+) Transcript_9178:1288-2085(+)
MPRGSRHSARWRRRSRDHGDRRRRRRGHPPRPIRPSRARDPSTTRHPSASSPGARPGWSEAYRTPPTSARAATPSRPRRTTRRDRPCSTWTSTPTARSRPRADRPPHRTRRMKTQLCPRRTRPTRIPRRTLGRRRRRTHPRRHPKTDPSRIPPRRVPRRRRGRHSRPRNTPRLPPRPTPPKGIRTTKGTAECPSGWTRSSHRPRRFDRRRGCRSTPSRPRRRWRAPPRAATRCARLNPSEPRILNRRQSFRNLEPTSRHPPKVPH